jgi:hypothetical protein
MGPALLRRHQLSSVVGFDKDPLQSLVGPVVLKEDGQLYESGLLLPTQVGADLSH